MSSIDQRVVQLMFDNHQFEQGIASTLESLDKLNKGLQLQGASKGLNDISEAAKGFSLGEITSGVESLASKFKSLSVVGVTAIATITNKAVNAGISIAKSFTLDPITAGFHNYETQINAVQTILANTGLKGAEGLNQVNKALADLNTYANQTVYNFSDMAKNIGTFTAAGVGLQTSISSIKGIANLAALSGSSAEQASNAMYQLSQAIAAGSVKLQDWNSVVNAGLGGKTFQTALENTARASGVAIDSIIKKAGSFRESLQKGWLTSDILTKTLSQFTGDLSLAQIKAMGYTDQQAQKIYELSQTAVNAATKIKTMSQLTDALKEEVATAYAAIFKTIFGDIGQATDLFTEVHNVAENALTGPIYALNNLLQGWSKLGGRTVAIDALKQAFEALSAVLKPIKEAFSEVFPPTTAKQLYDMTVSFRDFIEKLKIGGTTADELKRTFAGVFSALGIGWDIVKQITSTIFGLFGIVANGSGGILKFTANIGDFVVKLKSALEQGKVFSAFFGAIVKILTPVIDILKTIGGYVGSLFDKFDGPKATKALGDIANGLSPLSELGKLSDEAWTKFYNSLQAIWNFFVPLAQKVQSFFSDVSKTITSAFSGMNFNDVLNVINTGLFGGLLLLVKKFVDSFKNESESPLSGFVDSIKETFEGLTKTLEAMQNTLKAATLLEIAAAIGILTISVIGLSKIDQAGLTRSSVAITIMFTQLVGSMAIFQKFVGTTGFAKMPFMMGSLLLLASAVDILASSVKKLSSLDWNGLAKGLTGLAGTMGILVGSVKLMGNPESLISTGLGMIALSKGVELLVTSVTGLSGLSWTQLSKGLIGVGGLLTSLTLFSKFAEANAAGAIQGAGIVLLAEGIKILADSMKIMSGFSWDQIAKGLVATGGGLTIIGVALDSIPPSSILSAAAFAIVSLSLGKVADALQKMGQMSWGAIAKSLVELAGSMAIIAAAMAAMTEALPGAAALIIVAASLGMLTDALVKMGGMSWEAIAKSLVELAGSLLLIAAAMVAMTEALPGAAALIVVAAALAILTPVLMAFGSMSWSEIGKSMLMLAGVFAIFAAAGALLTPVVPTLLGLGAAVALVGVGMLAAGVGVLAFAAGLTALSVAGAAGSAALVAIVTAMIGLLPLVAKEIGLAVVSFAETIAAAAPAIAKSMITVLEAMINVIVTLTPKIVSALLNLLNQLLKQLEKYVPSMVQAGSKLLIGVLTGLAQNMSGIVNAATTLVVTFINSISRNLPTVIQAGVNLIVSFVNGLAQAIRNNSAAMGRAGGNLASAIIDGLIQGLASGVAEIVSSAENMANSAINAAKSVLQQNSPSKVFIKIGEGIPEGFVLGIGSGTSDVHDTTTALGQTAITAMSKSLSQMSDLANANVDVTPTITPVLDLSKVKKDSVKIGGMLGAQPLPVWVTSAVSLARNVSAGYSANQSATTQVGAKASNGPITFNQYNNSPKALSSAEIYRQTNNQLSVAKNALATNQLYVPKGALTV